VVVMSLVINYDQTVNVSKFVGRNDLLQGAEGRKYVLTAGNGLMGSVVKVEDTWFPSLNAYVESAVVENLVIDGAGKGVTGILLENVCKCQIRNITIRNCDVGIHIRNKKGLWSEGNCLKHIRMENVTKGIIFTTSGRYLNPNYPTYSDVEVYPGDSAGFTTIDDVGIGLADNASAVGIQVGGIKTVNDPDGLNDKTDMFTYIDSNGDNKELPNIIGPYSSRIRANVWLGASGGAGLKLINGNLSYGQSHLTVHNNYNSPNAIGIDLQEFKKELYSPTYNTKYPNGVYRPIWENQFSTYTGVYPNNSVFNGGFMLVTSNITSTNAVRKPLNVNVETDVITKVF